MTKRKKGHSPEQIVSNMQRADRVLAEGGDISAVRKELNMMEATNYRWRTHYGRPEAEDAMKLKQFEKENLALKVPLAEE